MDEFELIRRYFSRSAADDGVRVGVGDDGAILVPAPGQDIVAVVDTLVDGVHFPQGLDPYDIAWRAMAVNLSDIAAMGGTPRWATLALTLVTADPDWLERFAAGLYAAAHNDGVLLVGGDTTHGDQLVISVQLLGEVPAACGLTRAGAMPGDAVYVSGCVGSAAGGLELLGQGVTDRDNPLVRRFCRPLARIVLGQRLAGLASAVIDISDGLLGDLGKLAAASDVAADVWLETIPVDQELIARFGADRAMQLALTGGDDYELCFTVPAKAEDRIGPIARELQLDLTRIGVIAEGHAVRCLQHGVAQPIADSGYLHFAGGQQ